MVLETGFIALVIIFIMITVAIKSKKCIECIFLASVVGSMVLYGSDFIVEWVYLFQEVAADETSVWLVLVCGLFGSLIALLQASKGSFGFASIISKLCNSERKTLLASFLLGILIFVDDYLNILTIGVCMKGAYDKNKIPRESLAYMLDATGAPVCVLLPFSTWSVFLASVLYAEESVLALGHGSEMSTYIAAIPFALYPSILLCVIILFIFGVIPKMGTMKKAYERVEQTGKVYSDASKKYNHDTYDDMEITGNIWDFLIPMIVLVGIAVMTGDLLVAVVLAIALCFVIYIPRKVIEFDNFVTLILKGFADMLPVLSIVLISFTLERVLSAMDMAGFIIEVIRPILSKEIFSAVVFLLVAFLTFTMGEQWGMVVVVAPIVLPLGAALDANTLLIMGAIMSGGAFGSHACFYCDATVLASQSAGIDNLEHAISQLPYVLIASGLAFIGYLMLGFMM